MSDSLWPSGLPVHHQLPEFTQTHVHWVYDAIRPSHPLFSPSPPTFNLSQHQVFSNESLLCIRWPKYWSFSFSISPSDEYSGLISFRMDWLDLLAVQGTLKSLLLHHSSKAYIYTRDLLLCQSESHSVVSDSLGSHGLYSPWNSPGQNTGMCSLSLLQRIFPTPRSNPGLPHCRGRFFTSWATREAHYYEKSLNRLGMTQV